MTTKEVADSLTRLCSEGKFQDAMKSLYAQDIVSVEASAPPGQSRETKGISAVTGKSDWWTTNHEIHSVLVDGPVIAGSHFAVAFKIDATFKPQGKRFTMEEVAVYKVAEGEIVYEEFFYNT